MPPDDSLDVSSLTDEEERAFAATLIAELPAIKEKGIRKRDLAQSMERLLVANKIHIGKTDGLPSRARSESITERSRRWPSK